MKTKMRIPTDMTERDLKLAKARNLHNLSHCTFSELKRGQICRRYDEIYLEMVRRGIVKKPVGDGCDELRRLLKYEVKESTIDRLGLRHQVDTIKLYFGYYGERFHDGEIAIKMNTTPFQVKSRRESVLRRLSREVWRELND